MIHNHETWTSTCECEFTASGPVTRISNHCIRYGWLFLVQQHPCCKMTDMKISTPTSDNKSLNSKLHVDNLLELTVNVPTACSTSTTAVVQSHLVNHCLFAFCTVAQHSDSLHDFRCCMILDDFTSSQFKAGFLLRLSTVMSIRLRRFIFCSLPSVPTRKLWSNHGSASAPFGLYGHWRSFTRVFYVLFTVVLSFQAFNVRKSFIFGSKMACTA